jgi:hypothetical protein
MLVKKLFKLLSLLRLFQELRRGVRGHRHGYGSPAPHYHGDHWHPRSRKPKLSYLLSALLGGRRH